MTPHARQSGLRIAEVRQRSEAGPLLLGASPAIEQLRADIEAAARSDAKVLIVGETGVGKEIVARLVHFGSARCSHPFLAINCAGLPDSLLESELFGHVRGSFTDAYRDKPGVAVLADLGTLFLDELGEMSPRMQGVLLRFAETGEIHRLGSDRFEHRVNVRIIAATNRNLTERIASGEFRQDLFYRLNVAQISVPPLRDRGDDVVLLFEHYLEQYCRNQGIAAPALLPAAGDLLRTYQWPGNVRELKNVAERIAVRHPESEIGPEMLPAEIRIGSPGRSAVYDPPALSVHPAHPALPAPPAVEAAWTEMTVHGSSFWTAVHAPFMGRELTKSDVREVVRRGLRQTNGSYRKLTELFRLPETDYKRLLAFLYQHDCHLPVHAFKGAKKPGD